MNLSVVLRSPNKNFQAFKKIPPFVHQLLEKKHENYSDGEFAERALSNLARKLANYVVIK